MFKVGNIVKYSGNDAFLYELIELNENGDAVAMRCHARVDGGPLEEGQREDIFRPKVYVYRKEDMELVSNHYNPQIEDPREYLKAVTGG